MWRNIIKPNERLVYRAADPVLSRAIQHLTSIAEEAAPLTSPQMLPKLQRNVAARTDLPCMRQPVPFQDEGFLPAVEIEAVFACLLDQLAELAWRQRSDPAFRMDADSKQHFVFDDVAYARKDRLIEQRVASQHCRLQFEFSTRGAWIPRVAHHVGLPVVRLIQILFDVLQRARIEVQFAFCERKAHPRHGFLALVDAIASEQHEMHPHRKAWKPNQKVFSPALKRSDALTAHPLQVEFAVAFYSSDDPARKRSDLLAQNDNRRTLRHTCSPLAL